MGTPAARIGDFHACPAVCPGPAPHVGGPIAAGSANVIIGGMPAARLGDMMVCACVPDSIAMGSATVMVNNMPVARLGDPGSHGSTIVAGCATVIIG